MVDNIPKNCAGNRIRDWMAEHPKETQNIAFAAVTGLYTDEDNEYALPEHDSYPRGSGSDYVDHVGCAIECSGLLPLIQAMQAETEAREEEEES